MESANLKDISYSMCLDKKQQQETDPLKYTLPRKVYTWMDDDAVKTCHSCNKDFGFLLRKHHCRLCGKIFCFNCSKYRDAIPPILLSEEAKKSTWNDYIKSYVSNIDLTKFRVCIFCHQLIEKVNMVKKLIEVFKIAKLDIREMKKAGSVCKLWGYATNYYLSIFREIQYRLPTDEYNDFEKELLWTNLKYFSGHNRYLVHLLKICKDNDDVNRVLEVINKPKCVSCWSLMCSKNCQQKLSTFDAMNLIFHCFNKRNLDGVRRIAFNNLICGDKEFRNYIPMLAYYIKDDYEVADFLLKRCIKNFELLNCLYWELQYNLTSESNNYTKAFEQLKDTCSEKKYEQKFVRLLEGNVFLKVIKEISSEICDNNKSYDTIKGKYNLTRELILPLNPKIKIRDVKVDKIKIKNSATKPLIIPCLTDDNKIYKLMYKREDIRKDQIIMNIINLMELIVNKEEDLSLNLVTYNILPTDKQSGLIEIIDDSQTIYYIQEKIKSSILNYILEHNSGLTVKEVREKFIKSTAAYCVVTYLLGVGDRHLDNIMVSKDGRLFHIDFGYILGKDPVVNDPGIRITPEIVEAVGGFSSTNYVQFKDMCTKIYNCLRRNIDIFMNILMLLPRIADNRLSEEDIKQQVIKRFVPGENYLDAQLHLVNQLEKQNYTDKIKDWCHYHSKEQTISGSINRLTSALSGLFYRQDTKSAASNEDA
jgi:hypothetical protein